MTSRELCRVSGLLAISSGARPVLGIDTGTPLVALGLVIDGRVAASLSQPVTSHGASLADAVGALLDQTSLKISDLGAIAVAVGPGSFTGLRIGLSYAKGIALAARCDLVGVNSLDAIAIAAVAARPDAREGSLLCPVVDARRGEVYAALYRVMSDRLQKISAESVVTLEHLASRIDGDLLVVGDSRAKDAAALFNNRGLRAAVINIGSLDLRGGVLAAIGAARLARSDVDSAATLEPLYLRPPEAALKPNWSPRTASRTEGLWSDGTKN